MRRLLLVNVFDPEAIGERIKQARERAGLRQEDLADLLEVSTRTVQNYEAGATKPFGHLNAIASATRVTTEWLIHGEPASERAAGGVETRLGALEERSGRIEELVRELLRRLPAEQAEGEAPPG